MPGEMALPDTGPLADLPAERWAALGARLRESELEAEYARVAAIGGDMFEPACKPLRAWQLRRSDRPVDRAIRLLCLEDPVTLPEAESALGDIRPSELLAAGLLERDGDQVASRLRLRAHDGLFFFADHLRHGGEAVMGAGPLTGLLLAAAMPGRPIDRALDLGCGAGVVALALARHAGSVVATDINPRALVLARVNAALNGIANIDFRTGDLYEPVRGERFDRIACQPPFFPAPPGFVVNTYSHGGHRGDEIPLRVLAGARDHLAPGGRCVSVAEWPVGGDEPLAERLRGVVSGEANLLVIEAEGPDIDAFCIGDTAFSHPDFGRAYAEAVVAQREHMEALGIRGLRAALAIVEPAGSGSAGAAARTGAAAHAGGWTGTVEVADLLGSGVDATLIDRLMEARGVAHRGRDALLAARLRLREGTAFASGKEPLLRVLFERGGPLSEIRLDRAAQRILEMVDASPSVQAAAKRFVKESSGPRGAATDRFCAAVEQALLAGILEVVPAG